MLLQNTLETYYILFIQTSASMATTEKFNLKWNDFASSISGSFREIKEEREFQDVTLACQEDKIGAHRVVLAACSPTLRELLRGNQHHHPLLYLRGVKHRELQSVLDFIYHGEVNIAQDDLNSFLLVAEELQVKGLTQSQSESPGNKSGDQSRGEKRELTSSAARTKSKDIRSQPPQSAPAEEEIQEIVPIKTENTSSKSDYYETTQEVTQYEEEAYDNYQDYDGDQDYEMAPSGGGQPLDNSKGSYDILLPGQGGGPHFSFF